MAYRGYRAPGADPVLIIIIVNVVVYFLVGYSDDLISTLGLRPDAIGSQPWSIITSMFVHAGLWHIFANMLALFFFGSYLARLIGDRNFLILYFAGGILGSLFFLFLGPANVTAVGASGAIFALGGALTILQPNLRVFVFPIPAPMPLWIAIIGGFAILSLVPNVAWQAHLGGLVFGAGFAYYLKTRRRYY